MVFGGYKDNKPIDIPATNGTISLLAIIKWNALPPFVLDRQKEYDKVARKKYQQETSVSASETRFWRVDEEKIACKVQQGS